jgi:membrane protease YdiL (CAAX protease family)
MDSPPIAPWLATLYIGIFLASGVIWLKIIARWRRRQPILEYEPRQEVPWGPIVALPAIAMMLLVVSSGAAPESAPIEETAIDPPKVIGNLLGSMLVQGVLAGGVIAIAAMYGATRFDLGLPRTSRGLARDVGIGAAACLAAAGPVFCTQGLLVHLIGQEDPSGHPIYRMVTGGGSNLAVLLLATLSAVVAAPICEEIMYRLMLQGWLEKWEDKQSPQLVGGSVAAAGQVHEHDSQSDQALVSPQEVPVTEQAQLVSGASPLAQCGPRRGVFGLPHGTFPILASAALFAAAHAGYGPEPVPIFLLALIFGYVYQRTHRIVPTIVAHALFNLISMITMWQLVFSSDQGP